MLLLLLWNSSKFCVVKEKNCRRKRKTGTHTMYAEVHLSIKKISHWKSHCLYFVLSLRAQRYLNVFKVDRKRDNKMRMSSAKKNWLFECWFIEGHHRSGYRFVYYMLKWIPSSNEEKKTEMKKMTLRQFIISIVLFQCVCCTKINNSQSECLKRNIKAYIVHEMTTCEEIT